MVVAAPGQKVIGVASAAKPVVGMFSDIDKSLLGGGMFALLKQVRCDKGYATARNNDLAIMVKPSWATSAEPLGSGAYILNGTVWEVAVFSDGSAARIAVTTLSGAAAAGPRWVEVTGTNQWTGPAGNNRLTSITALVQMTVIKLPRYQATSGTFASRDVLLIQNGVDDPRLWDPDTSDPAGSPFNVTAVVSNAGQFRLTIGAHTVTAGSHVYVASIGGLPQLTGLWQVASVTATTINISDSVFAAGFTAGGTVDDRIDLGVHKAITEPSPLGSSYATVSAFWPIAGTTSKTYAAGGLNNQARYNFANSAAVPYNGTNASISWTLTVAAAAGDFATVYFANAPMAIGRQVVMLIEGQWALEALKQAKVEVNIDNLAAPASAWTTLYDPTGATDSQRGQFFTITQDSTSNRYWVVFDAGQVEGTIAYHLRFTRQGTAVPGVTQTISILFIGSAAQDIPASSEWGFAYEDSQNKVEQRFNKMSIEADNVGLLGGVQFVRDGVSTNTTKAPDLPLAATVQADWRFTFANSNRTGASNTIVGGLNGIAERVNLYVKLPGRDKFYYVVDPTMYTPIYGGGGRSWVNTTTDLIINYEPTSGLSKNIINNNREAPSEFQIPIPCAKACLYDNGRLFVGAVKDASGQNGLSDAYGSWIRNPLRFQQVQEDELRGFYLQVSGETIQAFSSSASAALGAGRVFMFTDKNAYTLGDSGPYSGASIGATELSTPYRIGPHGTLSPRSIAQGYNGMYWADQDCQIMRLNGGSPENIGKNRIADRLNSSVIANKPIITGTFVNDRYVVAYTPLGGSANTQANVWSVQMANWESEDLPAISSQFSQFHVFDTPTGTVASRRVFFYNSIGTLYAYNEDTTGTVAIDLRTGEYSYPEWQAWVMKEFALMITQQSSGTLNCSRYSRKWGTAEPWVSTIKVSDPLSPQYAEYLDASGAPTKTGTARGPKRDWAWQAGLSGSVTPGTQILRWEILAAPVTASPTKR